MIGHIAYADGSPCPTFVLDARLLPSDDAALLGHLAEARRYLSAAGGSHVLKIALVSPSAHPLFDLDYRFVQALPEGADRFDLRGSCGHSILAAVTVAASERCGMLPALTPGRRVRVNVLNNGDSVVCEVDQVARGEAWFTAQFVQPRPVPFQLLLPTGQPRTRLATGAGTAEVSLVSLGNAYAFVDARALDVPDAEALFAAGPDLLHRLETVRRAAADLLGWPRTGVFPKIAAVLPGERGTLAARAISVPGWHPTLALTGAVCLGAAARIPGTVPSRLAAEGGAADGLIGIVTPGGRTEVTAATEPGPDTGALRWTTVARKRAVAQGSFVLEPLSHLQFEEVVQCLAPTAAS